VYLADVIKKEVFMVLSRPYIHMSSFPRLMTFELTDHLLWNRCEHCAISACS